MSFQWTGSRFNETLCEPLLWRRTAGAIYDVNKSYTDVFLVVGGVYIVATLVFVIVIVIMVIQSSLSLLLSSSSSLSPS